MNLSNEAIERLHKDLPTIRKVVGWSAEHLAELLDVTRVTVVNLENTERKMSRIQYLAIRALLQEEIETNKNRILRAVLTILVDRDNVPEEMRQGLRGQIELAAKSVGRKAGSVAIAKSVGPVVEKTIGEMKLNEIPEEVILRGQAALNEILTRPVKDKKG